MCFAGDECQSGFTEAEDDTSCLADEGKRCCVKDKKDGEGKDGGKEEEKDDRR